MRTERLLSWLVSSDPRLFRWLTASGAGQLATCVLAALIREIFDVEPVVCRMFYTSAVYVTASRRLHSSWPRRIARKRNVISTWLGSGQHQMTASATHAMSMHFVVTELLLCQILKKEKDLELIAPGPSEFFYCAKNLLLTAINPART